MDPFKKPHADQKLKGRKRNDLYRLRIGDYRMIYSVKKIQFSFLKLFHEKEDMIGFEAQFLFGINFVKTAASYLLLTIPIPNRPGIFLKFQNKHR